MIPSRSGISAAAISITFIFFYKIRERSAPTKHQAFSEETQIWKIRIWSELTEKIFVFYFQGSLFLIF